MSRVYGEIPGFREGAVFANRRQLAKASQAHRRRGSRSSSCSNCLRPTRRIGSTCRQGNAGPGIE